MVHPRCRLVRWPRAQPLAGRPAGAGPAPRALPSLVPPCLPDRERRPTLPAARSSELHWRGVPRREEGPHLGQRGGATVTAFVQSALCGEPRRMTPEGVSTCRTNLILPGRHWLRGHCPDRSMGGYCLIRPGEAAAHARSPAAAARSRYVGAATRASSSLRGPATGCRYDLAATFPEAPRGVEVLAPDDPAGINAFRDSGNTNVRAYAYTYQRSQSDLFVATGLRCFDHALCRAPRRPSSQPLHLATPASGCDPVLVAGRRISVRYSDETNTCAPCGVSAVEDRPAASRDARWRAPLCLRRPAPLPGRKKRAPRACSRLPLEGVD